MNCGSGPFLCYLWDKSFWASGIAPYLVRILSAANEGRLLDVEQLMHGLEFRYVFRAVRVSFKWIKKD